MTGRITLANGVVKYIFRPPARAQAARGPPVVLLGGTAQTIKSLFGHHAPLADANQSGLLQYEMRGQGRATSLSLIDCSLERHTRDFREPSSL